MARRSLKALERAVHDAESDGARALALYNLGLFHDSNGREATAIPAYESALTLGLDAESEAQCLAWLASSLYKTGRMQEARERALQAQSLSEAAGLSRFLAGLKQRIDRAT
jgi:tetratricopeptide (TPR) repeat protein